MRRLILLLSCIVPLLAACTKEQISSRPCTFAVELTELKGTKVRFTITPSNPDAYYSYGLVEKGDDAYDLSGDALIEEQMAWLKEIHAEMKQYGRENPDFASSFCFQGRTEQVEMYLTRETAYKLIIFQVNPWKIEGLGAPKEVYFQTPNPKVIDLDFDLQFSGDTLRIHPSLPDQTYIWDYEEREIIEEEYGSPIAYFYSLLDMYEQYGFMDSAVVRGDDEWVFPRDDKLMPAGREWYLLMAGYQDGNINSPENLVLFTWKPGEARIEEWILP